MGLLTIYRLFTAHMTGTTVHLAEQLVRRNWPAAAIAASVVAAFLVGSIVGRVMVEIGSRSGFRRVASITFSLELLLIAAVAAWGGESLPHKSAAGDGLIYVLLAMLAIAMGLQTATLTRIGPLTIHTTFVTGMLNKMAQLVSRWLFLSYDLHKEGTNEGGLREERATATHEALLIFGIWMMYLLGAVFGTWLGLHWHLKALLVPCAAILVAIAVDQARPLSLEEEQEQSKL